MNSDTISTAVKPMTIIKIVHGSFSQRKAVDTEFLTIRTQGGEEVNKSKTSMSKRLMDSDVIAKCGTLYRNLDKYMEAHSLPISSILGHGSYAIPVDMIQEVQEHITEVKHTLDCVLKPELREEWEKLISTAQQELGPLFDQNDYHLERVVARFYIDMRIFDISLPMSASDIDQAAMLAAESKFTEWYGEIESALAVGVIDILDNLTEKITGKTSGGKDKTISQANLAEMDEFFELLQKRNVTGNADIELAAKKGRALRTIVQQSGSVLRQPGMVQDYVKSIMSEVKESVAGLVQDKPSRHMVFDDDEGDE